MNTTYHLFYPHLDRCYRLARYILQEVLAEHAVWAGQDRVLCALNQDRPTLQSELSRSLFMNEKTLNRSLAYLRKLRYVTFHHSHTDFRVRNIILTPIGKNAVDAIRHTYGIVGKQLCVGMSAAELEELNRLLKTGVMRERDLRARKTDLREVLDRGYF